MKIIISVYLMLLSFVSLAAPEELAKKTWDYQNNPYRINKNFEAHLNKLPLKGDLAQSKLGWPGYHWSLNQAMIANRWQIKNSNNFKYDTYSLATLRKMSSEQINKLSPAEKYDILMGDYSYPTVSFARGASSKNSAEWKGICHGVSPAGLHHKEPTAVTLKSTDGIEITFYSSDVKALLAFYYARISNNGITQIGKRCFAGKYNPIKGGACSDINAGSFHIIMTNQLGISQKGFIADVDQRKKVWNHVAMSYKANIVSQTRTSAIIEANVAYTGIVEPSLTPIIGTENMKSLDKTYKYELLLDSNGKIIGGEWLSYEQPDFVWVNVKEDFKDAYYGKILDLTL